MSIIKRKCKPGILTTGDYSIDFVVVIFEIEIPAKVWYILHIPHFRGNTVLVTMRGVCVWGGGGGGGLLLK